MVNRKAWRSGIELATLGRRNRISIRTGKLHVWSMECRWSPSSLFRLSFFSCISMSNLSSVHRALWIRSRSYISPTSVSRLTLVKPNHRSFTLATSAARTAQTSTFTLRAPSATTSRLQIFRSARPSFVPARHCSCRRNMCLRDDISGSQAAPKREVLPTNVKPMHYDLILEPDLEKFTYNGQVTIEYVHERLLQGQANLNSAWTSSRTRPR